ncbi:hypothetical protein [Micromonospora sp. LOL_024]
MLRRLTALAGVSAVLALTLTYGFGGRDDDDDDFAGAAVVAVVSH